MHYLLDSCQVMMWLRCHMTMLGGVFSFYSTTIESRNITFSASHVTTWLNCPVTLLVWSLCLEPPPCYVLESCPLGKWGYDVFICRLTIWLCLCGLFILSHHPTKFGTIGLMEVEVIAFAISVPVPILFQ